MRFELLPVFLPCVDLEISERVGGVQNYFRSPQVHAMVIFSALSIEAVLLVFSESR